MSVPMQHPDAPDGDPVMVPEHQIENMKRKGWQVIDRETETQTEENDNG